MERDKTPIESGEPDQLSEAPQTRLCRWCAQQIPVAARRCYHCNGYQSRLRESLRSDHLGQIIALAMMIIALWQVVITRDQLQEARQERVDAGTALKSAGDALARARQAETSAQKITKDVEEIRREVDAARKTILAVADTAQKAVGELDDVQRVSRLAEARLDSLDKLQEAIIVAESAQSGSVEAFVTLLKLSSEAGPLGELARRRASFVRELMSEYRRVPSTWMGSPPGFSRGGREVSLSEIPVDEQLGFLEHPGMNENQRLYLMGPISRTTEKELAKAALAFVERTDSLAALAATCGVLTTKFGEKADFLDRDKWIAFLRNYVKQP